MCDNTQLFDCKYMCNYSVAQSFIKIIILLESPDAYNKILGTLGSYLSNAFCFVDVYKQVKVFSYG